MERNNKEEIQLGQQVRIGHLLSITKSSMGCYRVYSGNPYPFGLGLCVLLVVCN